MKKIHILLSVSLIWTGIMAALLMSLASPTQIALAGRQGTAVPTQMSDTTIAVVLSKTSVLPGEEFDISVSINTDAETRGAQFRLSFDPKLVEIYSEFEEGGFYKDFAATRNASTIVLPQPSVDNESGEISITSISILGLPAGEGGATGQGVLMVFHGKAKPEASGDAIFSLAEILVADAGDVDGTTAALGGVKSQDAGLAIGSSAAEAAPTMEPKQATNPGAQAVASVTPEPTIVKITALPEEDQSGGSIPWEIILPIVGAILLGAGAIIFLRKR